MSVSMLEYAIPPPEFDPLENHPDPERLILDSLSQGTLLAGREKQMTWELDKFFSEGALHRYRAQIEIEALIHLAEFGPKGIDLTIDDEQKATLRTLYSPEVFDPTIPARIDQLGYRGVPANQHDVRAVEIYVGQLIEEAGLGNLKQWIHFGMTSEDTNNLAYNLMLRDASNEVLVPAIDRLGDRLAYLAVTYADAPNLAITHAQKAVPTTIGKQAGYLLSEITKVQSELLRIHLSGKFSGAVGNHNPMPVLFPDFDYDDYTRNFVESFGFEYAPIQNQRNDHIAVTDLLQTTARLAVVGKDAITNVWFKILDSVFVQELVIGEDGSSSMVQKINPWRLECAKGIFEQAIGLQSRATEGLIESNHERDLSDHPWQRAYGDMIGRVIAGYNYFSMQLDRLVIDPHAAEHNLDGSAEVLGELVQAAGRVSGDATAYETAKALMQGKRLDLAGIREVMMLALPDGELRERVLAETPETYVGIAPKQARDSVRIWHEVRTSVDMGVHDWRSQYLAVLLDLDDTIVMGDKQELRARLAAVAQDLDANVTPEELQSIALIDSWKGTIHALLETHNQKHPDQLISEALFNESHKAISGSFDHMFTLADNTEWLLSNIERRGMKLGLITNRGPNSLPRVLKLHNLQDRFDVIVHGQEPVNGKPYPEAGAIALHRLKIDGRHAMFVGDHCIKDIGMANALGMFSVLVSEAERDPYGAIPKMRVPNLGKLALKFER